MIQIVLNKDQWRMIGDIRAVHVSIGAVLILLKKGTMDKDEALRRLGEEMIKADDLWNKLEREGL